MGVCPDAVCVMPDTGTASGMGYVNTLSRG
jgi:hypothetical protein